MTPKMCVLAKLRIFAMVVAGSGALGFLIANAKKDHFSPVSLAIIIFPIALPWVLPVVVQSLRRVWEAAIKGGQPSS